MVSVSVNENNLGAGELADKYPDLYISLRAIVFARQHPYAYKFHSININLKLPCVRKR